MKKIKIFTFSILSAVLVTIGLYACNNEETNNLHQENMKQIPPLQSKSDGSIENGKIIGCDCTWTGDTSGDKIGYCNHSVSNEGLAAKTQKWLDVVFKALGLLKL